jgi:hypothetical protein
VLDLFMIRRAGPGVSLTSRDLYHIAPPLGVAHSFLRDGSIEGIKLGWFTQGETDETLVLTEAGGQAMRGAT